jgi:hypothetical protein
MGLFLTNSELQELTGYKLASKQSSWLKNRGYYVEINARGMPRITYTQVEERRRNAMIINNVVPFTQTDKSFFASEPNFNNLKNMINKASNNG